MNSSRAQSGCSSRYCRDSESFRKVQHSHLPLDTIMSPGSKGKVIDLPARFFDHLFWSPPPSESGFVRKFDSPATPHSPIKMARLRRSLRGAAPVKLTLEERFEKIISYVKDDNYTEALRQFHLPSHVSRFRYLLDYYL